MSLGIILIVILLLVHLGVLPTRSHSANWGYLPRGGLGLLALWFLLLPRVGPAGAAHILAAVLAVLCLILLALAGTPGHAAAIGKFRIQA